MLDKGQMYNDYSFSTEDLFRLEQIEKEPRTENEKFLCGLVEKFFMRVAELEDDIVALKNIVEEA